MDYNTIIIRFGEMSTKGKNRKDFINRLARNIKRNLNGFNEAYFLTVRHDHIFINILKQDEFDYTPLKEIAGIGSFSLSLKKELFELDDIKKLALDEIRKENGETFKIYTKRIDKSFPYISDEINREVAGYILKNTNLTVDVHNPSILLSIEIRNDGIYMFTKTIKGIGGYPLGSTGRVLMMLSGGIDSPVATYLMMKRGLEVTCIHFAAPPYTNAGVIIKLEDLLSKLNTFQDKIILYIIPFTKIQEKIYEVSSEGYPITIMRRMMYRISAIIANENKCNILVNGESIGQVASQTLTSMRAINEVVKMPVIRPVACFDKLEIIEISKKIGTFDISTLPYEDCCTVFVPKHPVINPNAALCSEYEELIPYKELIYKAIKEHTTIKVGIKEENKFSDLINLETFNYSPHELLAERDLEREKMIRLDTLNSLLKSKWNDMDKSEKQEFISKFIDTIEIKKDDKGNLILEKINFRNGFIKELIRFYDAGIFDVAVPVMINNNEEIIKGSRMSKDELNKYLNKMNEYFETSFYEMYEKIDDETNEIILEYQPKIDEKIIRFVALTNSNNFPILAEDIKDKYGIVSYKTNKLLES